MRPGQLARILARGPVHQHALQRADHLAADALGVVGDALLQALQARLLDLRRHVVGQLGGGGARARAVDEAEGVVEADLVDQAHGVLEVLVGLAGEADDEIRGQADVRARLAQAPDLALVLPGGVAALHQGEDAVGAALHRQVQVSSPARAPRHRPR